MIYPQTWYEFRTQATQAVMSGGERGPMHLDNDPAPEGYVSIAIFQFTKDPLHVELDGRPPFGATRFCLEEHEEQLGWVDRSLSPAGHTILMPKDAALREARKLAAALEAEGVECDE